ncbi:YbjQ family protein [Clostridium amazonitimonense]|uniref:YbjQ family protein n=1 Tax=Clostridium amazonitimonense TaxID=1499689 RepID=UPI000509C7C1|nr:YbjQ family protein [Clostridium amazonitimonense]
MIVSNLSYVPGKEIEVINMVDGVTVFSKHIGKDIMAGFKNMVGGEVKSYSEMVEDAKNLVLSKMIQKAEGIGAEALINVKYTMTSMAQGSTLAVMATATAVKVK